MAKPSPRWPPPVFHPLLVAPQANEENDEDQKKDLEKEKDKKMDEKKDMEKEKEEGKAYKEAESAGAADTQVDLLGGPDFR